MSYRKVQGGSSAQLAEAVIININGTGHSSWYATCQLSPFKWIIHVFIKIP